MKSTTGQHYLALDQLRALAALMVCVWHFTHGPNGYPVPFAWTPAFPAAALLDEGHTGVALFMTLSGYLFAKLLDGKRIRYPAFLWNRALRLLPLLLLVLAADAALRAWHGTMPSRAYVLWLLGGAVFPTLPNGGWSITVEIHFYLLLPALLWALRRSPALAASILLGAVAFRWLWWLQHGEVQYLAYWTLVGRIDQFLLGMLACRCRPAWTRRRAGGVFLAGLVAFSLFYGWFDAAGGFYDLGHGGYPSKHPVWIVLPLLEGLFYALAIAWYDQFAEVPRGRLGRAVARLGELSYSIYLLHPFFVFAAADIVHRRIMDLSGFGVATAWAIAFYCAMVPIAYASHRWVELPFLRLRHPYVVAPARGAPAPSARSSTA